MSVSFRKGSSLQPALALDPESAMAEFEQLLVSNSGEEAFDCAIKLLSAKLLDEMNETNGTRAVFRIHNTLEQTYHAICTLYQNAAAQWPHINGSGEDLGLSPTQLTRSIRPLLGWRFGGSDLTLLDATLERLVSKSSKGALGQYFTPRDVIRLCAGVLNPRPQDVVIDPACGSGGFLFEATRRSFQIHGEAPTCLGIDHGAKAIKVAALLCAASPHSRIVVSKGNSLDGRGYSVSSPPEWANFLASDSGSALPQARSWGNWNRLGCTLLLTNPPFAGEIDEPDLLDAYEIAACLRSGRSLSREHLFLERAIQMVRPGGRLAIVLPQGVLANASARPIRDWLQSKGRILGVIGLHPFAFLPYTTVKTSLLFLEKQSGKPAVSRQSSREPKVFFAISRIPGKDSSGRSTGTSDYLSIAAQFRDFLEREGFEWSQDNGHSTIEADLPIADIVPYSEVVAAGRLDAEYFDPSVRAVSLQLKHTGTQTIEDLVEKKIERFRRDRFGEIQYIDISSVDEPTGIPSPQRISASEAPSRAAHVLQPGDVLVSTVRPERNVVALVPSYIDGAIVASNGFCVLRAKECSPEMLFAYCKTDAFRKLLSRNATASMYPAVTDRDVLDLPIALPATPVVSEVDKLIASAHESIRDARKKLTRAVSLMSPDAPTSEYPKQLRKEPVVDSKVKKRNYSSKGSAVQR